MERKYKQRGYQDSGKPEREKKERPPDRGPRQEQIGPRTPRMVGTVTRARCSNCGAVLMQGLDLSGQCPHCHSELHCCKQCLYFDTGARFECTQPIPERISPKDVRNECTFFSFRITVEKDTAPSAPAAPPSTPTAAPAYRGGDARKAFDDLFKK